MICGECKYNRCDRDYDDARFFCGNEDSEYYGCDTRYDDGCDEGEEKE